MVTSSGKTSAPSVNRIQQSVLTRAERVLIDWLCRRLPAWVTPDMLTVLAFASTVTIGLAYALSLVNDDWLWVAVVAYFTHWFGDSLDGSIARFRKIERPRYGYFIDHSSDCLGTLLIVGGLGLSPYVRLDVSLIAVIAYLLLAAHTFLMAKVAGDFPLSHGGLGPTELRVILVALTVAMFFAGHQPNELAMLGLFDLVVLASAIMMIAIFVTQTAHMARRLVDVDHAERD